VGALRGVGLGRGWSVAAASGGEVRPISRWRDCVDRHDQPCQEITHDTPDCGKLLISEVHPSPYLQINPLFCTVFWLVVLLFT
jgi:hypothetical protein